MIPVSREEGGFLGSIRMTEHKAGRRKDVYLTHQFANHAKVAAPLPVSIPCSSICRLSESPQASPLRASSLIFSGSVNVNFRGSGVLRSASQNCTCQPRREKNVM